MPYEIIVVRGVERLVLIVCVPLLIYIGYRLFDRGASGDFQIAVKGGGWAGKAANLSPGAFTFLLGVALGIVAIAFPLRSGLGPNETPYEDSVGGNWSYLTGEQASELTKINRGLIESALSINSTAINNNGLDLDSINESFEPLRKDYPNYRRITKRWYRDLQQLSRNADAGIDGANDALREHLEEIH